MKVIVDSREASMSKCLKKITDCEVLKLPLADLLMVSENGALAVERKTVSDFLSSIRSNRLWDQLLRLLKTDVIMGHEVTRRLLVIHGGFWEYTNVSPVDPKRFWNSVFGALMEIIFVYDCPVVVCENNEAFESFLHILLKREKEGKNEGLPKARWYRKPVSRLPVKEVKTYLLDAVPMIGEVHAKKLLEHFGTISEIAQSSKNELMRVPGIGEKRAEKIYAIFH
jgi:ERCC4-type nuclease